MGTGTIHVRNLPHGVRILTFDRPPANAQNDTLLEDLQAALGDVEADSTVRAVVLTGSGKFFSAGFDLSVLPHQLEDPVAMARRFRDVHLKLLSLPKPTFGMLNGHAVGGGLVPLLACDHRVGLDGEYKVGINEVAIGGSYPRIAMEITRLRLSHRHAAELLLGAELYPAREAVRLGIVDELLPPTTFESTVIARATRVGGFPREAYAFTKRALITEAVDRVLSETPEEAAELPALWRRMESQVASARQRGALGKV